MKDKLKVNFYNIFYRICELVLRIHIKLVVYPLNLNFIPYWMPMKKNNHWFKIIYLIKFKFKPKVGKWKNKFRAKVGYRVNN